MIKSFLVSVVMALFLAMARAQDCGVADIGGWTVPVPSQRDATVPLRSLQQPGSRLFYISAATGLDATGDIYFWDGAQIIDSAGSAADAAGVAYGSDPMNPSAAVKAFKRWAYVGPRQNGSDIGTHSPMGSTFVTTRAGYPDWWLFKRSETFDLSDDILSFEREVKPTVVTSNTSLSISGGRSATERQIVGAYGDVCAPRPRFIRPQFGFVQNVARVGTPHFRNVAYLSLHFDGHDRAPPGRNHAAVLMLGHAAESINVLFEDMWFDGTLGATVTLTNGAKVTLRRVLVTDSFQPATVPTHVQGIFYSGSRAGMLRIEESILLRNGFTKGDPRDAWPPSGTQIWDHFSRNLYLSGETDNMRSGMFDSVSMIGASGDQFRPGMRVERNFFYQGYVSMGAARGYPDAEGPTGTMVDNVQQRFVGTGTNSNVGQPGWGMDLHTGAYAVEVLRNVVTGAQHAGTGPAFGLNSVCYKVATRSNRVRDNIFESQKNSAPVRVTDGVAGATPAGCFPWQFPGVTLNDVSNNILISPSGKEWSYVPSGAAVGTVNDTTYSGNKLYASRADAATALGWPDPNRTLRTYLVEAGIPVASNDGFVEYFNAATRMQRGMWRPDLTARPIVNHVRGGFGMEPLP